MKQIHQCFIKTISPLHIGCDEVYEPMGFVVDENRNELTAFDPITFISQLDENDKKRFSDICSRGTLESILEIYKFLRRRKTNGKTVQLCSGFVVHYNKTLSIDKKRIKNELNEFSIYRTSFLSADDRPYIPGSSVKGSLRTAYLNRLGQSQHIPTPSGKYAASDLEKKLLSYVDIPDDPFRLVKVSDFMPVGEIQTRIVYAVNIKKESGGAAKGPFQIVETIVPETVFCGNIVVEKPLTEGAVKKPIQLEDLLQSGRTFYSIEHNREQKELKTASVAVSESFFSKESVPIRIGRHSGAESVTIEGHRKIKINEGKGKSRIDDHATTIWLASEESKPQIVTHCKPFGWAELCEMTPMRRQEFEKTEKEWTDGKSTRKMTVFIQKNNGPSEKSVIPQPNQPPPKKVSEPEIWQNVALSYSKGDQKLTAVSGKKNATAKGLDLVSEPLRGKVMKKSIQVSRVEVEPYGNSFRLLKIIEGNQ